MTTSSARGSTASEPDALFEDQPDSCASTIQQQYQHDDLTDEEELTDTSDEPVDFHASDVVNTTNVTTSFRLMDLPPENRRQILRLVLPRTFIHPLRGPLWQIGNIAVLRTCQQLHAEGISILYSTNTFVIHISLRCCPQFLKRSPRYQNLLFEIPESIGPQKLKLIRKIEVEIKSYEMAVGFARYNFKNMDDMALDLQEQARNLVQALSQQCGIVLTATVIWMSDDARADMQQHRKTILLPLMEAGMQIKEFWDSEDCSFKPARYEAMETTITNEMVQDPDGPWFRVLGSELDTV